VERQIGTIRREFSRPCAVLDAVLLRPLPYPAQESLVKLFDIQSGRDIGALSFPEFIDWRDRGSDVFESASEGAPSSRLDSYYSPSIQIHGSSCRGRVSSSLRRVSSFTASS
jgi:hypothetical protein